MLRHSCAHVLAQAVQDTFEEAKLGIGPPIKDGFYYDFDVETPFTPEDIKRLEKRMQQIVKSGQRFATPSRLRGARRALSCPTSPTSSSSIGLKGGAVDDDVMEVGGAELTIYENVDAKSGERKWQDLCRGPAPAVNPADPGLQADALRRRLLAGKREEPTAAAHLRHGMAHEGRADGTLELPGGG